MLLYGGSVATNTVNVDLADWQQLISSSLPPNPFLHLSFSPSHITVPPILHFSSV